MRWFTPGLILLLGLLPLAAPGLPPVLREIAVYPALGLFPGLLVAVLLARRQRALDRWVIALALSPLISALAGLALYRLGVELPLGTALIAVASWAGSLLLSLLRRPAREDQPPAMSRAWLGWALGFAGLMMLLPALNPWLLVHFDSWFHAGMVWQIVRRGIPPDNPCYAGRPSNYMWAYNLFIAMLTGEQRDPLVLLALQNVVSSFLLVALIHRLGLMLWRDGRAATGAAALALLGLNAGAWLLWPLNLLKAATGQVRGWAEVARQVGQIHLLDDRVLGFLSPPFAYTTSLIDKFTEGTALSYAWILLLLYLWSALAWLEKGRRSALGLALITSAGLFFIHAVVALSAVPMMLLTLAALMLIRVKLAWLPGEVRVATLFAVTAAGAALGAPYFLLVSQGWAPADSGSHFRYIQPGYRMAWTLLTSTGVTAWLAWRPLLRAFRERLMAPTVTAIFMLAMTLFALAVSLPTFNESKFVFQIFFPLAILGGVRFFPEVAALVARRGRWVAAAALGLVFAAGPLLTVCGYLTDPRGKSDPRVHVPPAEARLHAWIREQTPVRAVFLDGNYRDLLMVHGQRRLYLSAGYEPFKLGFPAQELLSRTAVMTDLYGPRADLATDAAALRSLGEPVYVLYRPEDRRGALEPWQDLARRADLFGLVYSADDYHVFGVRQPAQITSHPS